MKSNEICYALKMPMLSTQEANLLQALVDKFQTSNARASSKTVQQFLKQHCIENLIDLGSEQQNYFTELLEEEIFGFGPVSRLLADDSIEEIAVIGTGSRKPIYVYHRNLGWMRTNFYFSSEQRVHDLVNKMGRKLGRRLTAQTPVLNATLPDGSRLNAAIAPIAFSGTSVTIRKFRRFPFTPLQLVENRTMSNELAAFLWIAMEIDCSILIAGNTGSGKTSTLNALFSFVPADERIVSVEETPEIVLPHRHIVKLNVVKEQNIEMQHLIVDTLRMRPDRIIVGEIRDSSETKAFIDTLLAGQGKGSYSTFHSQSVNEAITRMRALGIPEMDLKAIDLVVVQRRWNSIDMKQNLRRELRRITEVAEIDSSNGNALKINRIFEFDYKQDCLRKAGESKRIIGKACNSFSAGRQNLEMEIKRRAALLQHWQKFNPNIENFFRMVNNESAKRIA